MRCLTSVLRFASYLQAGWWVRSRVPCCFRSSCKCASCTVSTGRSGPPHRSHWLSPPAGWARPSGPLPPLWTCRPYPPGARRWQSLSLCACACFQVVRFLFSEYSSLDIWKKGKSLSNCSAMWPLVCVPGASLLSDRSKLPRKSPLCLRPVSSLPLSQICASGSKGKGPDCSCPSFKSPLPFSPWAAACTTEGLQV